LEEFLEQNTRIEHKRRDVVAGEEQCRPDRAHVRQQLNRLGFASLKPFAGNEDKDGKDGDQPPQHSPKMPLFADPVRCDNGLYITASEYGFCYKGGQWEGVADMRRPVRNVLKIGQSEEDKYARIDTDEIRE
jgi:hypothetical protein